MSAAGTMRTGLALAAAWVAYLVLFLLGVGLLGPSVGERLTATEQANSLPLVGIVAAIDTALFTAWLVRARERGWRSWLQAFVVFYGVKTFSSQLETWWFVKASHVPPGMLPSLFLMTLPLAIGWTGLAAWMFAPTEPAPPVAEQRRGGELAVRAALAGMVLYPLAFFLAGYFIAWQSAAVRAYYEGPSTPLPFLAHFAQMFAAEPQVVPFEMARGLLWVALGWPVLRRTRGPWWVGGLLYASMLAVLQNDVHLFPNPLMPREVRLWHLLETASSNFVFGLATAALLAPAGALRWSGGAPREPADPLRRRFTLAAVPLLLFLAVGGLYGGAALVIDPSGGALVLDPALLRSTPFPDYEVPGVVLFLANGVFPLFATVALLAGSRRAPWWVAACGAVLTGWITAQVAWIGYVYWLQPAMGALGVVLLALGVGWLAAERRTP